MWWPERFPDPPQSRTAGISILLFRLRTRTAVDVLTIYGNRSYSGASTPITQLGTITIQSAVGYREGAVTHANDRVGAIAAVGNNLFVFIPPPLLCFFVMYPRKAYLKVIKTISASEWFARMYFTVRNLLQKGGKQSFFKKSNDKNGRKFI